MIFFLLLLPLVLFSFSSILEIVKWRFPLSHTYNTSQTFSLSLQCIKCRTSANCALPSVSCVLSANVFPRFDTAPVPVGAQRVCETRDQTRAACLYCTKIPMATKTNHKCTHTHTQLCSGLKRSELYSFHLQYGMVFNESYRRT